MKENKAPHSNSYEGERTVHIIFIQNMRSYFYIDNPLLVQGVQKLKSLR